MSKVTVDNYVSKAKRTESKDWKGIGDRLSNERSIRLLHTAMGLQTEAGEFTDALKKTFFYGKKLDTVNLEEELGDLFWYIAIACDELNIKPVELMTRNIKKLQARFPEKFTEEKAENRDLEKERSILEGEHDPTK